MPAKPQSKREVWKNVGYNLISGTRTTISMEQVRKSKMWLEAAHKKQETRRPRPNFVRGCGLTQRLFDTLMNAKPAPVEALPSAYLPTISQHVESIAPSKNVFAQYWCPVIFEDDNGTRHVVHVDPLVVRTFRRTVAEELQHVRDKRKRMLSRMNHIRGDFAQMEVRDTGPRLRREIAEAKERSQETLLADLAEQLRAKGASTLHIFVEATSHMFQLELVCQQLVHELRSVLQAAEVRRVSFSVLGSSDTSSETLPSVPTFDFEDSDAWSAANNWLSSLKCTAAASNRSRDNKAKANLHLAHALRWVTTTEAFDARSKPAVLFLACSKPADLEASIGLARRSNVLLQIVGVFGLSPENPEPGLQELADSAAPGSSFRLFFGPLYWSQFITAREHQLRTFEENGGDSFDDRAHGELSGGADEKVSSKMFEMRLIERIMRECYSEEQQCEEELTCATRLFERTLFEREDLLAILRGGDFAAAVAKTPSLKAITAPATAR